MDNEILREVWPEWQIVKKIGEGSFGVVYEAIRTDYTLESHAAIKIISIPQNESEVNLLQAEGLTNDEAKTYIHGVVKDFVKEIQLMESFKGVQNIVSVEDYKVVEKINGIGWNIIIRMELLTPFREYISNNAITEKEVIKIGCDICSALELCAKRNVIHRDIKPENIFVNSFGDFKIGDFGIARKLENVTGGLSQKGTYNYMAPEVERGNQYDLTVDLYSLGVVLYQLLNDKKLPFIETKEQYLNHNDRMKAIRRRMDGEPLLPPCNASSAMTEVILCACSPEPQNRFRCATDMKNALMKVADGTYQINDLNKTLDFNRVDIENFETNNSFTVRNTHEEIQDNIVDDLSNNKGNGKKSKKKSVIIVMALIAVVAIDVVIIVFLANLFGLIDFSRKENIGNNVIIEDLTVDKENEKDPIKDSSNTTQISEDENEMVYINIARGVVLYDENNQEVSNEEIQNNYSSIDEVVNSGKYFVYTVSEEDRVEIDGKVADESGGNQRNEDGYYWARFNFLSKNGDKVSILFRCDFPYEETYPRKYGILEGTLYDENGNEVISSYEDTWPDLRLHIAVMTPGDGSCDMSKAYLDTENKYYYKRNVLPATEDCFIKIVAE